MKIGLLLLHVDPSYRGGVNSFIHGLLGGLLHQDKKNEYIFIIYKKNEMFFRKYKNDNVSFFTLPNENKIKRKLKLFLLHYITPLPILRMWYTNIETLLYKSIINKLNDSNINLYYCPTSTFFPIGIKKPVIVSTHDIQHIHFPENFKFFDRMYRKVIYSLTMKQASAIQASTEFIKKDFAKHGHVHEEKITVIPEGVMNDILFFKQTDQEKKEIKIKLNLSDKFIFYPAQHWPHKNHKTLIKAIALIKEKYNTELTLVCSGERSKQFNELYNYIDEGKYDFVHFLGNIKFNELLSVYTNALCVAIPVVYESSSLPIKEAMALNVPVIASKNGANEEINKNENILLFDTYNHQQLADQIYKIYKHPELAEKLTKKSKEVIKNYSWNKIAKQYISFFKKIEYENKTD